MIDFIFNGAGTGSVAEKLLACNFNTAPLRMYRGGPNYQHTYMPGTRVVNGKVENCGIRVANANALLRKDEWIQLDEAILKAAKPRLRVFGDLRAASSYVIRGGLGKTTLEFQRMSDVTAATISMDGMRQSQNDRVEFDLSSMPLPIIHKDFQIHARQLQASRESGSGLDTSMAELSARRVAEEVEKLTLGVSSLGWTFGGGQVYGYTNFPSRNTKTLLIPTDNAWTPAKCVDEVLDMKQKSKDDYNFGPWVLYNSPNYDKYFDADYSAQYPGVTLRDRIKKIDGITDVRTADYLTGYQMILVQMAPETARAVVGMDMTTLQWESHGGMLLNYKILCVLVPQLRADINGNCGIVHGST